MDGTQDLDIGFQEVTVKNKRIKKGSKIFKKLLEILHSGKERHVIQFTNKEKTEFEIKLIDKKNKKQWRETDISLFLALDSISPKHREQENLAEKTKNRFKANMNKLVGAGYLKYLGSRDISKAVSYKKYRILKDCPIWDESEEGCFLESTDTESKESSEDISSSLGSPLNSSYNFPSSHCACLSGKSSENKNMPYGIEENINIRAVGNEKAVGAREEHIGGAGEELQNLSIVNPNVGELIIVMWINENMPYESEENINIRAVGNEKAVGAREEHIGGAGEELQNLSIVNPNVAELMWINKNMPYGSEGNINIQAVGNEKVVGAREEHIGGAGEELQNLSIVNPNVGELMWINENMSYGSEENINIRAVGNEKVVGAREEYIGGAGEELQNLSIVNPNVEELMWINKNMPYGSEARINIAAVASDKVVGSKEEHIDGEVSLNFSVVNPNVDELNSNKSDFDDATMFEEAEDDGILKDSKNPFLSSAVVTDEMFGFTSDDFWENDYKILDFDETMYDSK